MVARSAALATCAILAATGCSTGGASHAVASHSTHGAPPIGAGNTAAAHQASVNRRCLRQLDTWSTRRLAAQTVTVTVDEGDPGAVGKSVAQGVGGVLLFGNDATHALRGDLRALVAAAPHGVPPLVMTDEEGGGIQRVARLVGSLPWPRDAAATQSVATVRARSEVVARRMHRLGITMNLAPVLDLNDGPGPDTTHPDGKRSYSLSPTIATKYGLAFADGMIAGHVLPVVKHFPGLGTASSNTDFAAARTAPLSSLMTHDIVPFKAAIAAGLPAVMVDNAVVPGLSSLPVVLSRRAVTGLLRHTLGFRGLIITDALNAGAISSAGYDAPRASVKALRAGVDLTLLGPNTPATVGQEVTQTITAIVGAVSSGQLTKAALRAAVQHVLIAKRVAGCV
jgi:beta-N-acetylhexosaminidase